MTTDDLLILLIFVVPSIAFILLLCFCSKWAARLAVWVSVAFVLLVEWQFFVAGVRLARSNLGVILHAPACVLVTAGALFCLLASRIPSLRRHCTKWILYLLFSAAYGLVFLHGAQIMEALLKNVCPWAEHPFGVNLATSGLVLYSLLLLWMLVVYALASHLDASQRQLGRSPEKKP